MRVQIALDARYRAADAIAPVAGGAAVGCRHRQTKSFNILTIPRPDTKELARTAKEARARRDFDISTTR